MTALSAHEISALPRPAGLYTGSGNRCGHQPENPNFLVQDHAGNLPKILQKAIDKTPRLYANMHWLNELNRLNQCRKKRSERREAHVQVICSLLKYLDLASLLVGMPTKTGFHSFTLRRLHKETTLSWPRYRRAFRDLCKAGLVTARQPRAVNRAGQVRGLAAVKCVSRRLFEALELNISLKFERNRAAKRARERAAAEGTTTTALYDHGHGSKPARLATTPRPAGVSPAALKMRLTARLLAEHPNASPADIDHMVAQRLRE